MTLRWATSRLKTLAKRAIPEQHWRAFSAFRGRVSSLSTSPPPAMIHLMALAIRHLPLPWAVRLKESLKLYDRLDYPGHAITMALDSRDQLKRLRACDKEPETVRWLERSVRRGDVIYDIGANVGAYSLLALALAGGARLVYAFEPSFSTFAALCLNVFLNGRQGEIVPVNVALSDRTGVLPLRLSSLSPGAASHDFGACDEAVARAGSPLIQPVLAFRLDELVALFKLHPPNLIKLDADGPELEILAGARGVLSWGGLRSLLVEVDEAESRGREIPALLHEVGFAVASKHPHHGSVFNYIFERRGPDASTA